MQPALRHQPTADGDSFPAYHDDRKDMLIDRRAIFESVTYLLGQGLSVDEVQRCLVSHFYVDLDLLNEALTQH